MTVITRFAPSPTGYLHIGGARTALFNWLFARHYNGKFLLRIEDTDRTRSTNDAIQVIFKGLEWLGLDWDEDPIFQFSRANRHITVAEATVKAGHAYYCYCSPEELEQMKQNAIAEGRPPIYDGRWRDRDPSEAPSDVRPVIRIRMPREGETVIHDTVQGTVTVQSSQLDDMILVRSDGTPTYMLAVVVDDHDMGITHIIRGDDHLTNAFRQKQIYEALGWATPIFSHIPLIHGSDGTKLSKRHGALGVDAYKTMGFLPEAMRNYLARLSWAHGDDEIFSTQQAIEWFDGTSIGKSAARFDMVKLTSLNGHYIQSSSNERLLQLLKAHHPELTDQQSTRILLGMDGLKQRAKTLVELWDNAQIYVWDIPPFYNEKTKTLLDNKLFLSQLWNGLSSVTLWEEQCLHDWAKSFAETHNLKLGDVAQPIRAVLTGSTVSPSIFEVATIIGRELVEKRFQHVLTISD
jgi:glutamyl-tRNA synthetase